MKKPKEVEAPMVALVNIRATINEVEKAMLRLQDLEDFVAGLTCLTSYSDPEKTLKRVIDRAKQLDIFFTPQVGEERERS